MVTPGRDQRAPMERLVRLVTVLHQAGSVGVEAGTLLRVAGFEDGKDGISQLTREFRHPRQLGWQIDNLGGTGHDGRYRMVGVDNRLRLALTPPQLAALRRAALLADRADLAAALGIVEERDTSGLTAAVEQPDPSAFSVVALAVAQHSLVRFRYRGTERLVHPVSLRVVGSTWYLRAIEDAAGEADGPTKTFVVARMSQVQAGEPGSAQVCGPAPHQGLHPLTWPIDEPVEVTLLVPADYVADVEADLLAPGRRVDTEDGVELHYRVTHRAAFRHRLYELGHRVRVLGPGSFRDEMLAELAELAGE